MRRSLTGFIISVFSARALLICAMFVVLLVSVVRLRNDDASAQRSSDLLVQSFAAERSAVDLETGVRGFLLTHRGQFLSPYDQARAKLPKQLLALRTLANDPAQRRWVEQISGAINNYIDAYATPLIAAGSRLSSRREVQVAAGGKLLLDRLRTQFNTLDARVLALRARQRRSASAGAALVIILAVSSLAASLALALLTGLYLLRSVLRPTRTVAEAAERLAAGELEVRVPEVGRGEVEMLARSFNEMADAIQSRDRELLKAHTQLEHAVATAEEASAMKSSFLANMSHEIRTPLNGIVGMLTLLSDTPLRSEQREYIDIARASSDALMTVVNDVLDIAKIEAGRMEIERRDFDLHEMVEATCEMFAASARSAEVELQAFVHNGVPRTVCGDRLRVSQILTNLVSNAVKFTAEGEVVVEVRLGARSGDLVAMDFEVSDTGIGMSPERIDRLFEPFTQAEAGTTRKFGGTGLGLAISRELTRLMDGAISAESEPGRGSRFRFQIPFAPAQSQLPEPIPAAELGGLRVLVVDDNAANRRVFEAYTAAWGMRAEVASDAGDALAKLRRAAQEADPFELALLDLNMPGESGTELARRITASPMLSRTRLILLTSSGQAEVDDASFGIRCAVTKPVRRSRLLDAISAGVANGTRDGKAHGQEDALQRDRALPPRSGAEILVAEDQAINWMLIERMLIKLGHSATNAADGHRALEMVEEGSYDLVFMDCQMPSLDGYETAREIRRREAARGVGRLPIVAMTANAMLGDRERCLEAGMDDYMSKPISADVLSALLARWLPRTVDARSAAHAQAAAIDQDRLEELRELFPGEELTGVIADIGAEVTAELGRIATAAARDDLEELAAAAHRIKNSAQMIGAAGLAGAASALERGVAGQRGVESSRELELETLVGEWESARVALELERSSRAVKASAPS